MDMPSLRRIHPIAALALALAGVIVTTGLFTWFYVSAETGPYLWDYSNFQRKLIDLTALLRDGGLIPMAKGSVVSVMVDDYNVSSVLPLLPSSLLFGPGRGVYIVSVVLTYLVPAVLLSVVLAREVWRGRPFPGAASLPLGLWGLVLLLFSPFWVPSLRGYPDIVVLLPLAASTLLVLRTAFLTTATLPASLAAGLGLWLAFLLRRYAAYAVIALVVTTVVFAVDTLREQVQERRGRARRLVRNLIALLAVPTVSGLLVQRQLIERILASSYADLYAAYDRTWFQKGGDFVQAVSPVWAIVALIGLGWAVRRGERKALFCALAGLLTFVGFGLTQAAWIQHTLIFVFWFTPLLLGGITLLLAWCRQRAGTVGSIAAGSAIGTYAVLGFLFSFLPAERRPALAQQAAVRRLLPPSFPPLVNPYVGSLRRLAEHLERESRPDERIVMFTSREDVNDAALAALHPSLQPRLKGVSHIDSSHGFDLGALDADLVVTSSQPLTHLPADRQRVITIPARAVQHADNPYGRSHRRLSALSQPLGNGVRLEVYRRIRHLQPEEKIWITAELRRWYPEWKERDGRLHAPN
jgi:hypothetical protein